jgi:hypothetical protein
MDDLGQLFGPLSAEVPDGPPGEVDFVFRRATLPSPPRTLVTHRLAIFKGQADYNGWYRVDRLLIYLDPRVSRELALYLLACVFHDPERSDLVLSDPHSEIKRIVYRSHAGKPDNPPVGLSLAPTTFRYFPSATAKHPWPAEVDIQSLPLLALSNEQESFDSETERARRDTIFVESSVIGTVRLAELLLNAGCSWNPIREYDLECDAGFRGVAPMSAEVKLVLPGSTYWEIHPTPEAG